MSAPDCTCGPGHKCICSACSFDNPPWTGRTEKAPAAPLTPGQRAILADIPSVPQTAVAALLAQHHSRLDRIELKTHHLRQVAQHAQNSLDLARLRVSDAQRRDVEAAASYVLSTALSSGVADVASVLAVAQARWQLHAALNAETEHIANPAE